MTFTSNGAAGYQVYQQKNGAALSQIYGGNNTGLTCSSLTEDTYCYQVRAINSTGSSAWNSSECTIVASETANPTTGHCTDSFLYGYFRVSFGS